MDRKKIVLDTFTINNLKNSCLHTFSIIKLANKDRFHWIFDIKIEGEIKTRRSDTIHA